MLFEYSTSCPIILSHRASLPNMPSTTNFKRLLSPNYSTAPRSGHDIIIIHDQLARNNSFDGPSMNFTASEG